MGNQQPVNKRRKIMPNRMTKEEFEQKIKDNKYLEYAIVHSNKYYGTPNKHIDELLSKGKNIILEIDIEGARKVNEKRPDAVFIFIMPPSMEILKKRISHLQLQNIFIRDCRN